MSTFEYTSVLASIIIGLALVDILVSLNRLIRAAGLVRWHWGPPATAALIALTVIQIWWSSYQPQAAPTTIGQFLPLLVELVLLFLLAAAALPDEVPAGGLDLKLYYDDNGPYLWALFTAAIGWVLLMEAIGAIAAGQGAVAFLGQRLPDLLVLAVFASLIFVRTHWWQVVALLLISLGPISWLSRSLGGL